MNTSADPEAMAQDLIARLGSSKDLPGKIFKLGKLWRGSKPVPQCRCPIIIGERKASTFPIGRVAPTPDAIRRLGQLAGRTEEIGVVVMGALARPHPHIEVAAPILLDGMHSEYVRVRLAAARSIQEIGRDFSPWKEDLEEFKKDPIATIRQSIGETLMAMDPPAGEGG